MKNKYVKPLILIAAFLILSLVTTASYAFFVLNVQGNESASATVITSGNLQLVFGDGDEVSLYDAYPTSYVEKYFAIINTGNMAATYDVYLSDIINEFADKNDLVYTIESVVPDEEYQMLPLEQGCDVTTQTVVPSEAGENSKIISSCSINVGHQHTYKLKILFKEDGTNQDDNKDKVFMGKLSVNEYTNNKPYTNESILLSGWSVNGTIKKISGQTNLDEDNSLIKKVEISNTMPDNIENATKVSEFFSLYPVYAWFEDDTLYLYTESDKIYLNEDSESLFDGLVEVTSIDLSKFDTSKVTNMSHIFANCQKLQSIDLSTFDTSNVTDMSGLFGNDFILETITFGPNFNTSNAIYMNNMFHNIKASTVDLSNFDTRKVVDMSWMFCGSQFTSLDLSSFDTSNVENMYGMIANMPMLSELNLGNNFDTSNVTNMRQLFRNLGQLEVLDLGDKFNVEKVTEYAWLFSNDIKAVTKTIKSKNDLVFSSALDTDDILFTNTQFLTGGYGTAWTSGNRKKNYAVIDCGPKRPGYLTYSGTQEEYEQFCSQFD